MSEPKSQSHWGGAILVYLITVKICAMALLPAAAVAVVANVGWPGSTFTGWANEVLLWIVSWILVPIVLYVGFLIVVAAGETFARSRKR